MECGHKRKKIHPIEREDQEGNTVLVGYACYKCLSKVYARTKSKKKHAGWREKLRDVIKGS
jgi:hypothetical protein